MIHLRSHGSIEGEHIGGLKIKGNPTLYLTNRNMPQWVADVIHDKLSDDGVLLISICGGANWSGVMASWVRLVRRPIVAAGGQTYIRGDQLESSNDWFLFPYPPEVKK
jgi:hypothetical protein